MYYLFILESIGTSELLLIAVVALMIFGPRKLPELVKTVAKTMADFRRSTDEFKKTWEKEVESEVETIKSDAGVIGYLGTPITNENTFERNSSLSDKNVVAPEIKEINKEEFDRSIQIQEVQVAKQLEAEEKPDGKRNWL